MSGLDFDPKAGQLHVSGRVSEENKYVQLGQSHTLDLELNRNFTLVKEEWDSVSLGTLKEACDAKERSEIGAVVLQEGLANVCLVTEHMTVLRQKVEAGIPRKRRGSTEAYEKGLERFYKLVMEAILRHFDFDKVKAVLLASPGFVAEGLRDYLLKEAVRTENKAVLQSKSKFIVVHTSSGHIHALNEVLKSPEVTSKLSDTRYARETRAMDEFFEMMNNDEDRAWYGPKEVARAVDRGAVGTLLISNRLFRSESVSERRKYVKMVEDVRAQGGTVLVLSSIHASGERLEGLGGLAAILTYPLQDLDASDGEEERDEEERDEEEGGGVPLEPNTNRL